MTLGQSDPFFVQDERVSDLLVARGEVGVAAHAIKVLIITKGYLGLHLQNVPLGKCFFVG